MKGVWSEQFTEKPTARYERCLICPICNARICRRKQSHTIKNPNRWFFDCPHDKKFFKWEDEVKPHEWIHVPYCGGCRAGLCRVKRETTGPYVGRVMFLCRVKEGEGSCGYRVWKDELETMEAREAEERMNILQSGLVNSNQTDDSEAVEAIINNHKHLQVLKEEISSTMDQLFQIEAEVLCCDVEMRPLELQLEKVSQNKKVLQAKHSIASKQLEEYQNTLAQKEAEQKAAFDRVRALPTELSLYSCNMYLF